MGLEFSTLCSRACKAIRAIFSTRNTRTTRSTRNTLLPCKAVRLINIK